MAGLRLAIEVPGSLPWEWPEGPLRRFASPPADADMEIGVRVGSLAAEAPDAGRVRYDSGGGIFDVALDGRELVVALRIRGVLQRVARLDAELRRGEVVVAPDSLYARECYYPLAYPLDEVLFLHRIVRDGGILVHACGVVRQGTGLLFTGPSGAGKTTLARLMQGGARASVLSDDRIALRDEDGGVRMHGTPWHGDAPLSSPRSATLSAIHVIRHAAAVLAEPLAGATAAAALLGNSFLPAHDPAGAEAALALAERIVERAPVIRLGFPKDERVVRYAFGADALLRPEPAPVRPAPPRLPFVSAPHAGGR